MLDLTNAKMENLGYPFIAPSSTCPSEDLLFFDTFSHSGSEKDNFDLVQFPSPVVIDVIKIVPLGQPIEAKIPGNVRLGATNPSNCELEFFINDLSKQDAHTMTDLGKFYCSEKVTDFNPPLQIQTDGLLLRGSYRTLTLAIFGQIATFDERAEDEQAVLSAASPPAQTPASPVASERDIPYIVRSGGQEMIQTVEDDSVSFDEPPVKNDELIRDCHSVENGDMIDDATIGLNNESMALKEVANLEDMSGSEIEAAPASFRDKKNEDIEYSDSTDFTRSSIKDEPKDATKDDALSDGDYTDPDAREWLFDVSNYRPKPSIYFPDPSLTLQERSISAHKSKFTDITCHKDAVMIEVEKVREMFDALNCTEDLKSDDWVTLIEDLANDILNLSLSQTVDNEDLLRFLVKQVCHGLDIKLALRQKQTGFKVRHLRAGIKLATVLFHCGEAAVSALIQSSIPQKVLRLYEEDQMSLPLRLLILRCLNIVCDSVEGVEHVISHKYDWPKTQFSLGNMRKRISALELKKGSTERDELISKFEPSTIDKDDNHFNQHDKTDILDTDQFATSRRYSEEEISADLAVGNEETLTCYQYMVLILLSQPTTRITIAIGNLIKKIRFYTNLSKLAAAIVEEPLEDSESGQLDFEQAAQSRKDNVEQNLVIIQDLVSLMKDGCTSIAQPVRYLPAKVQFQVKPNHSDPYLAIYRWLKHFQVLDSLNNLLNATPQPDIAYDSMSTSEIEQSIRLQNLCLLFINQILDTPRGTQSFLSNDSCASTCNILKTLAGKQPPKRSSHLRMSDGIENCLSASLCKEESLSASSCNDLSLRLSYSFKIFSCIDKLFHFHRELISKRGESSNCNPEKVLHQLYIMIDHPYGLAALVKHLSCIGNLDCLLRFLDMPEYHKQLEFVKETSIEYALELIGTFFRLNNSVLEIADEYLDTLIDLCKTKDKTLSVRIKSLLPWLTPFNTDQPLPLINYSEETFRQLTRVIRKSIPNYSIPFAKNLNFELPPQMITAVRIIRQLCIPPQVESFIEANFDIFSAQKLITSQTKSPSFMAFVDSLPHQQNNNQSWNLNLQISRNNGLSSNNPFEDSISDQLGQISNTFKLFSPYEPSICGELKYHYGIMQIYEQEGLKRLLNTLRELTGNYPRPIYQSAALSGFRGRIVISYIHSVTLLLHSITCHLIDARGSEFKDTSIIPVILETYSLLCFVPKPESNKGKEILSINNTKQSNLLSLQKSITLHSDNYQLAQQTKKLILSILMSYTQMCLSVSESEEKVISKSMWTKMLKEVMDFTLSTPVFFQHGLDVLTKILPSPLPCSSMMDSIDQEQLFKNINHRKLWSAHLHPLHQRIEQMISHLSICYQSSIRTLLYYLCNQLSDLSSNAACLVAKIITDTLISCASKLALEKNVGQSPVHPNQQQQQQQSQQQPQQTQPFDDTRINFNTMTGAKESAYAVKMILNLLSNLITNQAFESAFTNHLQMIGKKDEKLLANLQNSLRLHDDYRPGELMDDIGLGSSSNNCLASVTNFIEAIKAMNDSASNKDNYTNQVIEATPPEELTKINLLDVARKTSDRFSLASGLKKTYRLKVLLDLNSRAHRSNESISSSKRFDPAPFNYQELAVPPAHKAYVAPLRGRGRPPVRPDSFRSRPQNTSRPPSIHVDDFIDIYGGNSSSADPPGSRNYPGSSKSSSIEYGGRGAPGMLPRSGLYPDQSMSEGPPPPPPPHRHPAYFSQLPGSPFGHGSAGSGRPKRKRR